MVRDLGLVNPSIVSTDNTARSHGALVGYVPSGGSINSVYVSGGSISTNAAGSKAGGLVGYLRSGTIRASYATATVGVSSDNPNNVDVGGLVGQLGWSGSGGGITASYAAGAVSGGSGTTVDVGGLVGKVENTNSSIANSYCDTTATMQTNCLGATVSGVTSTGYTTAAMQTPTGYTGIYTGWNLDLDGLSGNDDPWAFGASDQYPVLKYAGLDTTAQFAAQPRMTTNLDIDNDGTADLTDAIMVILYLFGLENEGITDYILFSQQATRTDPQAVTDYIASLLP